MKWTFFVYVNKKILTNDLISHERLSDVQAYS